MTAFLSFDVLRVPGVRRDVLRRSDAQHPVRWFVRCADRPVRRWRTGNKVPELPPG
jgi:hypothetical protein